MKQVYQQVKEKIVSEIKKTAPGEYIQSEIKYAGLYQVSRLTVRKAVTELVEEGLLERVPGKGLRVPDKKNAAVPKDLLLLFHFDLEDGFYYNIAMGCVDAANQVNTGYRMFNIFDDSFDEAIQKIDLTRYSGAIIHANDSDKYYTLLRYMDHENFPFVLIDNKLENYNCSYVISDDYKGGYLQGTYLAEKGHRNIIYLSLLNTEERTIHTAKERELGFRQALSDHGIQLPPKYYLRVKNDAETVDALSRVDFPYTAICAYSDIPAMAAYQFATGRGLRVPEDVSIMGYSNFRQSEIFYGGLTTIAMPSYEMGKKAAEMILQYALGKKDALGQVVMDVELIERGSVREQPA